METIEEVSSNEEEDDSEPKNKKTREEFIEAYKRERSFKCDWKLDDGRICQKRYKRINDLTEHKNSVHLKIKYKCDECEVECMSRHVLKQHKKNKHSTEKFICSTCAEVFENTKQLKTHHRTHWEKERLKCPNCDNYFHSEEQLTVHVAQFHQFLQKQLDIVVEVEQSNELIFSQDSESSAVKQDPHSFQNAIRIDEMMQENAEVQSSSVIASVFTNTVHDTVKFVKFVKRDQEDIKPNFDSIIASSSITMFYNGSRAVVHKKNELQRASDKENSMYFVGPDCQNLATIAKGILQVISLILDYMVTKASKVGMIWSPTEFDFKTQILIGNIQMKLLIECLKENNISVIFENEEGFVNRTKRSPEDFWRHKIPNYISTEDIGLGHVYIIYAIKEDKCHVYVGQRRKTGIRTGSRCSSTAHRIFDYTWEEFCKAENITSYYEDIIYFINEDATVQNPQAEAVAIEAFFFMQGKQCDVKLDNEIVRKEINLVNKKLVKTRWTKEVFRGINIVCLRWASCRLLFTHSKESLHLIPSSSMLRNELGGKLFD